MSRADAAVDMRENKRIRAQPAVPAPAGVAFPRKRVTARGRWRRREAMDANDGH